jgi:hypothetical protein
MGSGAVAVFYSDDKTIMDYSSKGYMVNNLKCDQMTEGWGYDIRLHKIISIPPSAKSFNSVNSFVPVTDFILTGSISDDVINKSVTTFLSGKDKGQVLILSHAGYSETSNKILNIVSPLGYPVSVSNINPVSLNDNSLYESVKNASYFVFAGDSLSLINLLSDSSYKAGKELKAALSIKKPVLFIGSTGKLAGSFFVNNTDTDDLASWYGRMTISPALSLFNDFIFQPFLFEDSDFFENRSSSVLWGMMRSRKSFGVYLDKYNILNFNSTTGAVSGTGDYPFVIIDARNTTLADSSTYKAGKGTRQVVAMNNLRYSLCSRNDFYYSLNDGSFYNTVSVSKETPLTAGFTLSQNYPNPFNPETIFSFYLDKSGFVDFRLYNLAGEEIGVLLNGEMDAGRHEVSFRPFNLASGIYFAKMKVNSYSKTIKLCFIK